jgi:hypothetical protein
MGRLWRAGDLHRRPRCTIAYKHIGPIDERGYEKFRAKLEKALAR